MFLRLATVLILLAGMASNASAQAQPPSPPGVPKQVIGGGGGRGGVAMLSPAILVGSTLYISGQLPARDSMAAGIGAQTRSVIATNVKPKLEAAGMTLADVVQVTAYLVDMADYAGFNTAYREFFNVDPTPTRTTVVVKELVNGAKVELTMVAVKAAPK